MQKFKNHHELFNTCGQHLVTVGGVTVTLDELFKHFEDRIIDNAAQRLAETLIKTGFGPSKLKP